MKKKPGPKPKPKPLVDPKTETIKKKRGRQAEKLDKYMADAEELI